MITKTRQTAQGTEYWDNKEKRVRFVPAGKKPDFEVTDNAKSMIGGVDLATGKDKTVVDGQVIDDREITDLSDMTIKELRQYADDKEIKIPSDITKRDDIAQYIYDNWKSDDE